VRGCLRAITETNRTQLVLFGTQNRAFWSYLAGIHGEPYFSNGKALILPAACHLCLAFSEYLQIPLVCWAHVGHR
jgi:hypothetical protein